MDVRERNRRNDRPWLWAAMILGPVVLSIGCSPGTLLTYFMMPFNEDKCPPQCELKTSKKEVTVVLNTFFATMQSQLKRELLSADTELNKKIAQHLQARFKANRDPIKIIDDAKTRHEYHQPSNPLFSAADMGKDCGADYVINIEIDSLSIRKEKSWNLLFEGTAEIHVSVTKMENGDLPIWEKEYRISFPETGAIDASHTTAAKFRADFLTRIAMDISRYFARYPREERMDMREE